MNNIKVGIIGLGVGFKHLSNLIKNKKVKEIYVYDKNKQKSHLAKKLFKKIQICKNENELFNNKNINLMCICSYDNYHFMHVKKSILHKKDIFIEKPLCLKKKELEVIKKLTKKYNVNISSNFVLRENSFFKALKEKIKKGFFGKIYLMEANYNYGRLEKITSGWRGKIKNYSTTHGGAVHLVDLVQFLTGKKFFKVASEGNNISTKNKGFKFFDCISSIIKFSDNSVMNLTSNFGSISPHHHCLNIFGTKGSGIYQLDKHLFISYKNKDKLMTFKKIKNNKKLILNDYISRLVSKKKLDKKMLMEDREKLFETTKICIKIDESVTKKEWLKI
tara:strand:- start:1173 stop:2171 length:999 start_codon:yes stop_codon:yes gene_type:complete